MKLWVMVTHEEDGSFTAVSPALPGCVSHGGTTAEALSRHHGNVMGYLASATNFVPDSLCLEVAEAAEEMGAVG